MKRQNTSMAQYTDVLPHHTMFQCKCADFLITSDARQQKPLPGCTLSIHTRFEATAASSTQTTFSRHPKKGLYACLTFSLAVVVQAVQDKPWVSPAEVFGADDAADFDKGLETPTS